MTESFSDLPDALVRDLLEAAVPVAEAAKVRFDELHASRDALRESAWQAQLVRRKADLELTREPSVAGIDGSYQMHRLTSVDLCAAAAVGVEGTAKEARRHWQEPYHRFWTQAISHNDSTTLLLRGLMVSMELELARNAPHDLVLLDGGFASLIIYLNQGLSNLTEDTALATELKRYWNTERLIDKLITTLGNDRTIAMPKYTSRNELASRLRGTTVEDCDGRTLATLILQPGEYTAPIQIFRDEQYHLPSSACTPEEQRRINTAMANLNVIYFRPFGWAPALRLEVPGAITNSPNRLSMALRGIESQFFSPAVVEPYPLFLADRMVKSLGAGVAVVEQTISQRIADNSDDLELTMMLLQNYRTESGRGGV